MPKTTEAQVRRNIRAMCERYPNEVMQALLVTPFWPVNIDTKTAYERYEDDSAQGKLTVFFIPDGDGGIEVFQELDPNDRHLAFRFRTSGGGGQSQRVLAALRMLAVAIKLDNEEHPQHRE